MSFHLFWKRICFLLLSKYFVMTGPSNLKGAGLRTLEEPFLQTSHVKSNLDDRADRAETPSRWHRPHQRYNFPLLPTSRWSFLPFHLVRRHEQLHFPRSNSMPETIHGRNKIIRTKKANAMLTRRLRFILPLSSRIPVVGRRFEHSSFIGCTPSPWDE